MSPNSKKTCKNSNSETREAPSNEGASFIFGAGEKRAPSVVSENAPQGTLP
jgi:hypothetical protein